MQRSQINTILRTASEFIRQRGFPLPPFAGWTPQDWSARGNDVSGIVRSRLGWDITDFGLGDFTRCGLLLFTLRNGSSDSWRTRQGKLYAEKIMVVEVEQITPMHFHWHKMEDIINRGGGRLMIQMYNSTPDESLDTTRPVELETDGVMRTFQPGEVLALKPGESVSLPQGCYHQFRAEGSRVLVGEVSLVNDDHHDNRFLQPVGRFPQIEEDEEPLHLLVEDYEKYWKPGR